MNDLFSEFLRTFGGVEAITGENHYAQKSIGVKFFRFSERCGSEKHVFV